MKVESGRSETQQPNDKINEIDSPQGDGVSEGKRDFCEPTIWKTTGQNAKDQQKRQT